MSKGCFKCEWCGNWTDGAPWVREGADGKIRSFCSSGCRESYTLNKCGPAGPNGPIVLKFEATVHVDPADMQRVIGPALLAAPAEPESERIKALKQEVERLRACLNTAALRCFMKGGTPEEVQKHMDGIAKGCDEELERRGKLLADAVECLKAVLAQGLAYSDGNVVTGHAIADAIWDVLHKTEPKRGGYDDWQRELFAARKRLAAKWPQ